MWRLINSPLAGFRLVVEHTRALVACVVVLGSSLTHLSLIVFIRSSERFLCDYIVRLHRVALGVRVASQLCLLLLEVGTSSMAWWLATPLKHARSLCGAPEEDL
jgi:hypothetical protein